MTKPIFFASPSDFRQWLEEHHASTTEVWVGYFKKSSGKRGIVYPEALDQALCFGWIDGIVKSIDEDRYMQRFTPRRPRSYWSAVNIRKMQGLIEQGLAAPAGLKTFEGRTAAPPGKYSNENKEAEFDAATLRQFKAKKKAWAWFTVQPPSFKRLAVHWVTSAKKEETRASRRAALIDCASRGERPPGFVPTRKNAAATVAPSGSSRRAPATRDRVDRQADRRATRNDKSRARR